MHRIMSSSKMLANGIVRKGRKRLVQNISVRGNVLIRGNMHKCLACGGVLKMVRDGKGFRFSGFYPKNKPYPHKPECTQKNLI